MDSLTPGAVRGAPPRITIRWCPACGRDDRVSAFTGASHFSGRSRCEGTPVRLAYVYNGPVTSVADRLTEPKGMGA